MMLSKLSYRTKLNLGGLIGGLILANLSLIVMNHYAEQQNHNLVQLQKHLKKIDKTEMTKLLQTQSSNFNHLTYEFQNNRLKIKIKSLTDTAIYELIDQVKQANFGIIRPIKLSVIKNCNVDEAVNLSTDIFQATLEFEVIGCV